MALMTMKDIRLEFAESSGRRDLIGPSGDDNGADKYIKDAADWLDEQVEHPKSVSRYVVEVAAGDVYKLLPRLIQVHSVWIMGSISGTDQRQQLLPRGLNWLRSEYGEVWSTLTQGTPWYYSLNVVGLEGTIWDKTLTGLQDVSDIVAGDHFDYTGLLFLPPADGTYLLTVFGDFYQRVLNSDSAVNYWTAVKPLTLVKAACMKYEAFMRNFEGEDNWEKSVKRDLRGIAVVTAGQETGETCEMEG